MRINRRCRRTWVVGRFGRYDGYGSREDWEYPVRVAKIGFADGDVDGCQSSRI